MMQDLIKAFRTYAGPDTDAQRKQYQRMLDLTRSAANACTGLYGEQCGEQWKGQELFIDLHLAELKALAYSNDRNGIKAKYCCFQKAIQDYRNNQCCEEQCRENVLAAETTLLEAIHKLETESWLERLRYIVLLSIGIPLFGLAIIFFQLARGHIDLPDWLTQAINDALLTVLGDPLRVMPVLVLPIILFLVMFLLIRRVYLTLNGLLDKVQYLFKARGNKSGASKQANRTSVDGDSSA